MLAELLMSIVVVALNRGLLKGPVHPFDLPVGPRVIWLSEAMLDAVLAAGAIEGTPNPLV